MSYKQPTTVRTEAILLPFSSEDWDSFEERSLTISSNQSLNTYSFKEKFKRSCIQHFVNTVCMLPLITCKYIVLPQPDYLTSNHVENYNWFLSSDNRAD